MLIREMADGVLEYSLEAGRQVQSRKEESQMRTMIGFTSSMANPNMETLHRAKVIFCSDPDAGSKYGRAKVFRLTGEPGEWRHEGVAVVYGLAQPCLMNMLRKQVPPVLILVTEREVGGRKTKQIMDRLCQSGKTVVQLILEDGDVTKVVVQDGAAEITTVSIASSTD